MTAGKSEQLRSASTSIGHPRGYLDSHTSRAGARRAKAPRPVTPGPPKLNRILPLDGWTAAGTLKSSSVSVSLEVDSV
jgi:hypothetical protein